jgi:ABC-type sugar transport system ATPase subunit
MQLRDEGHTSAPVPALRAVALAKQVDGRSVLSDVDLDVVGGQVHGIVGDRRAGSMLARILGGAELPDAGRIEVAGRELDRADPERARRAGVWTVAEPAAVAPSATIEAVLGSGVGPGRLVEATRRSRDTVAFLRGLGLGHLEPSSKVGLLGSGDQWLVQVARAAYHHALVVVLDHPEAALQEHELELLHEVLGRLVARGTALVYVTSRPHDVYDLCDSLTLLVPATDGGAGCVVLDRLAPRRDVVVASGPAPVYLRSGSA